MSPSRREALVGGVALLALPGCATATHPLATDDLAKMEARSGGRLGAFVLDTATGRGFGHRADERFGMCSTFKLPLAALVLAEVDAGRLRADEVIRYGAADMVRHAPITEGHRDTGMSLVELAEAAQLTSDNVAANLLIRRLGGPDRVTASFRAWGDAITRLDRLEPDINFVPAGETRDTTTPRAMAALMGRLLGPDLLSPASRKRLADWMVATETGLKRIRAGLPAGWRAGDKTGTAAMAGMAGKANDVAAFWPDRAHPVVVAAYYEAPPGVDPMSYRAQAVLAAVGRIAADWTRRGNVAA